MMEANNGKEYSHLQRWLHQEVRLLLYLARELGDPEYLRKLEQLPLILPSPEMVAKRQNSIIFVSTPMGHKGGWGKDFHKEMNDGKA